MRRLGGQVGQRARGGAADARASGIVDRPSRRSPESSEGWYARRTDLVAWPAGLNVAGRGLARGQTRRKSMWVMVSRWGEVTPPSTKWEIGEQVWRRVENLSRKSPQASQAFFGEFNKNPHPTTHQ